MNKFYVKLKPRIKKPKESKVSGISQDELLQFIHRVGIQNVDQILRWNTGGIPGGTGKIDGNTMFKMWQSYGAKFTTK